MFFTNHKKMFYGITAATLLAGFAAWGFFYGDDDAYFLKIYHGIDVFTRVYKDITLNYVDQVDPDQFMRAGIDGMLKTLDPYTVYIGENENDEIDLVTTGKYGGVGVTIGLRDGNVTVIGLVEGYSAAKRGIEIGDRIVGVNDKTVKGQPLEDVRLLVRGVPGTEVKITVEREGEKAPLDFMLMREEISVHNITYSGFVEPGIGYIRLERFSRTASDDLRNAIKDLEAQGEIKGVVLDLRGNPGGLLEIAVEVVSKFVPQNSVIVSTRGRKMDSEHKYFSSEIPMLPDIPLAVLVDRGSASASEIVAGAIQDLDRGIIVGERTFGKGLVQTIDRISENSSLKITSARYYTPSGRCIQELDYWHRGKDGRVTVIPDSVKKEFFTLNHRPVWDGGGVKPDTIVADTERVNLLDELQRKGMYFKYANHYASVQKTLPEHFEVTNDLVNDFERFLNEKDFTYKGEGESQLKELREIAGSARYSKSFTAEVTKLDALLNTEKASQLHRYEKEIRSSLNTEILEHMKGARAGIESTFADDDQLHAAIGVLKNKKAYDKLLKIK